jgi:hypothetical protein
MTAMIAAAAPWPKTTAVVAETASASVETTPT